MWVDIILANSPIPILFPIYSFEGPKLSMGLPLTREMKIWMRMDTNGGNYWPWS